MPPMIYRPRCLTKHPACVPDVVQIAVSSKILPSATVHGQKKDDYPFVLDAMLYRQQGGWNIYMARAGAASR